MNNFIGLVKKDWILSRRTAMLTIWITAGMLILTVALSITAYFYHGFEFNIFELHGVLDDVGEPLDTGIFLYNIMLANFPGLLALIFAIALASGALNNDSQKHCDVFYRIQPVSLWKVTASRYLVTIGGNLAVLFVATFGLFILSIIMGYMVIGSYNLWIAFKGMIMGYVEMSLIILVAGSFSYLCSAIFKDKAFAKGLGIILIATALIAIINVLFGWHIPQPVLHLGKFLFKINKMDISLVTAMNWSMLFRLEHLWKIVFASATYVIGSYLYKMKEVK